MSMLKIAATLAVIGGMAASGSHRVASAAPTARDGAAKQTLSVTIVGARQAPLNTGCEYTAQVSGGTPPYYFSWYGNGLVSGSSLQTAAYYWSSTGQKAIWVDVEDQLGDTGGAITGVMVLLSGTC